MSCCVAGTEPDLNCDLSVPAQGPLTMVSFLKALILGSPYYSDYYYEYDFDYYSLIIIVLTPVFLEQCE